MIVADNNMIVPLHVLEPQTEICIRVLERDAGWCVPLLWRSEFTNILVRKVKEGHLSESQALSAQHHAVSSLEDLEQPVDHGGALKHSFKYRISGYDAEYVWLAEKLNVPLVTCDKEVLKRASHIAIHPKDYLAS